MAMRMANSITMMNVIATTGVTVVREGTLAGGSPTGSE
jgi:hypothetical protein